MENLDDILGAINPGDYAEYQEFLKFIQDEYEKDDGDYLRELMVYSVTCRLLPMWGRERLVTFKTELMMHAALLPRVDDEHPGLLERYCNDLCKVIAAATFVKEEDVPSRDL
jgi:hypothetical protein